MEGSHHCSHDLHQLLCQQANYGRSRSHGSRHYRSCIRSRRISPIRRKDFPLFSSTRSYASPSKITHFLLLLAISVSTISKKPFLREFHFFLPCIVERPCDRDYSHSLRQSLRRVCCQSSPFLAVFFILVFASRFFSPCHSPHSPRGTRGTRFFSRRTRGTRGIHGILRAHRTC